MKLANCLVIYVLLYLQQKMPVAAFFRFINEKPVASRCFEYLCKENDTKLLQDFYYQDDKRFESAQLLLNQSFKESVCRFELFMIMRANNFRISRKSKTNSRRCFALSRNTKKRRLKPRLVHSTFSLKLNF